MRLSRRDFETLVREALQDLPPQFRSAMKNLAILVEEWPTAEDLDETGLEDGYGLFGLYKGVPLPERGASDPLLPDTITLYQRPIESACGTWDEVAHELKVTLLHEVGHYLGMSEEDLERLGLG